MKLSGIYIISFRESEKFYIGSSKDLCRRGREHLTHLLKNKHKNRHLQKDFNKYGADSFIFDILCEIVFIDRENLLRTEQQFLDNFLKASTDINYFKNYAYNLSTISLGSNQTYKRSKKISVFDLNMNFIEEVDGVRECERKYNVHKIKRCCDGKTSRCGNFIFKYSDKLNITYTKPKEWRKYHKRKNKIWDVNQQNVSNVGKVNQLVN